MIINLVMGILFMIGGFLSAGVELYNVYRKRVSKVKGI
jgi:hypothetical protein